MNAPVRFVHGILSIFISEKLRNILNAKIKQEMLRISITARQNNKYFLFKILEQNQFQIGPPWSP